MTPDVIFNKILTTEYTHGKNDVNWALVDIDNELHVMFQGSTTKTDWIHNFEFLPKKIKPYKNMVKPWYAHKGFVEMYQAVRNDILSAVAARNIKTVYVDGHSQGGGVAQLCAEDLSYWGYKVVCCTFGSPRVFYGKEAMDHLHDFGVTATNYENGSDIVPIVPPGAFTITPIHVGEPFCIWNIFKTAKYHMGYGAPDLY